MELITKKQIEKRMEQITNKKGTITKKESKELVELRAELTFRILNGCL